MKNLIVVLILQFTVLGFAKWDIPLYKDASVPVETRVENLLAQMTLDEKIAQLNQSIAGEDDNPNNLGGKQTFLDGKIGSMIFKMEDPALRNELMKHAMEKTRLGIPILFGQDVIHGFRTVYPIPLAQSCSFNPELVSEACAVAAEESVNAGINWTFAPMIDVSRDPRWGRVAECYGEDPYVNSVFCVASVRGFQGDDLAAPNTIASCLKHYIGYSESEGGRDYNYSDCSMQTLWDIYFPPYEAGVEAGAATLMSAFNDLNGIPASANHYCLTEVLREKWGFDGFVVSDWNSVEQLICQGYVKDRAEAAEKALEAGVDMDMKDNCYLDHLAKLVADRRVEMETIDEAVRRVLRVKFRLGLFDRPYTPTMPDSQRYLKPGYLKVAESLAVESMVLLKNKDNLLPLRKRERIALIGPLATDRLSMMGSWRGKGHSEDSETIREGFVKVLGDSHEVLYAKGCQVKGNDSSGFAEAVEVAEKADVIVLCMGESFDMSGENASMSRIKLPGVQEDLVEVLSKTGKPIVLVLVNGRPLELEALEPKVGAIMEIWQPGICGGSALAKLLVGKETPSGKLSITFPRTIGHIPFYYNHRNGGRAAYYRDAKNRPIFNFGDGLSYTTFEYSNLKISKNKLAKDETIKAQITVTNTGNVDAKETVFWYITDRFASITRPVMELKNFTKLSIKAGQSTTVEFDIIPEKHLAYRNSEGEWIIEKGGFVLNVSNKQKASFELF